MARGRPPIITDERILEVACDVFLERGIRATTAEVAERAGISEATVFHRFKTKDALFRRAMQGGKPTELPPFLRRLEQRAGTVDVAELLQEVAMTFIEIMRYRLPMMMMAWSNPDTMIRELRDNGLPMQARRAIIRYFEAERRLGRLHTAAPEVLATMFFGSLHGYSMQEMLDPRSMMPAEAFVREFVRLLLIADADEQPASGEAAVRSRRRASPGARPREQAEKRARQATKRAASGGGRSQ
ncbi:MAG: TetR/AcrR family transcriptional regulator [Polyangiaceae bacterium]|nr:TetR/AcrR family transcriptional regulator [Polyangiaceae bacterium]